MWIHSIICRDGEKFQQNICVYVCQCACDATDDSVGGDVTVFCRVDCVEADELLSDVDIFARAASASGKFGGVTGVFAGVRI